MRSFYQVRAHETWFRAFVFHSYPPNWTVDYFSPVRIKIDAAWQNFSLNLRILPIASSRSPWSQARAVADPRRYAEH